MKWEYDTVLMSRAVFDTGLSVRSVHCTSQITIMYWAPDSLLIFSPVNTPGLVPAGVIIDKGK
jgi:hypothetical protein